MPSHERSRSWWSWHQSCKMCLKREMSCFWMAGKGPIPHADECFSAICVLSERSQKHLQLVVWLYHCVHRAIFTLPRQESQIVHSMINHSIYHRKQRSGYFVILNQDIQEEFGQKGVRQSKESWDVVDLSWAQSSAYEWKVGVLRGHYWQVQFDFAESQRGHRPIFPMNWVGYWVCTRHPAEDLFYYIPHRSTQLYSNSLKVK